MQIISKLKALLAKPYVKPVLSVLVVLMVAIIIKNGQSANVEVVAETTNPLVRVTSAADFVSSDSLSLIGTVRAFTEAKITAETGGRVTSVNTKLGSTVGAGQIIATIENASEQASLLQAQGSYEAALAGAAQSNIGVAESQIRLEDAQKSLRLASESSYGTVMDVLTNSIDQYYSNPNTSYPSLQIKTFEYNESLRSERKGLQTTLSNWSTISLTNKTDADLIAHIDSVKVEISRVLNLVDVFTMLINDSRNDNRFAGSDLSARNNVLVASRTKLLSAQNSLDVAKSTLLNASESRKRAELSSTGGETSLADAQVKQALGSLRAAQANFAKTILRSPIAGTVNSLDIKSGDYISAFTLAAVVANNNALEIVSYVGDKERDSLAVGDIVIIDGSFEGIVTQISPAVDATTRKTEVRIAAENQNIKNGDTVKITRKQNSDAATVVTEIRVPLTAVKFEIEDGFVFTVEDGVLKSHAVTLGTVNANSVVITSGLSADEVFVIDVRGLLDGQSVEVKN